MDAYTEYDALGLAELISRKEVKPEEVLGAAVARAEKARTELNCFSAVFPEIADEQLRSPPAHDGPFAGVPFATKDLAVEIAGAPLTNGSRGWRGNVCEQDSEITRRYRDAGLVLFAQTTSPEFGLTTSTESALYGQTRNPWDLSRTSGGSSGGASAAVASGVIPMAQASDGGGSIRIPAACTGLFGMKPSRGRTPMGPRVTENWQGCSTVHAVSRTVRDNAALLDATHGREPGARIAAFAPHGTFLSALEQDPEPLRIALWEQAPNGTMPNPDAKAGLTATADRLESVGHVVEAANPGLDGEALGKAFLMTISADLAETLRRREAALGRTLGESDLEPITRQIASLGNAVPMVELASANRAFQEAAIQYERWMHAGHFDIALMPALSRAPDPLGRLSLSPSDPEDYNTAVTTFAPHCAVYNQIGCPAMSVPLHWTEAGLPIGMMFGARMGEERLLYQLAGQIERAFPWADRKPNVFYA
ncbi:MAG: amidase [Pseudomonadota bacterium]